MTNVTCILRDRLCTKGTYSEKPRWLQRPLYDNYPLVNVQYVPTRVQRPPVNIDRFMFFSLERSFSKEIAPIWSYAHECPLIIQQCITSNSLTEVDTIFRESQWTLNFLKTRTRLNQWQNSALVFILFACYTYYLHFPFDMRTSSTWCTIRLCACSRISFVVSSFG